MDPVIREKASERAIMWPVGVSNRQTGVAALRAQDSSRSSVANQTVPSNRPNGKQSAQSIKSAMRIAQP